MVFVEAMHFHIPYEWYIWQTLSLANQSTKQIINEHLVWRSGQDSLSNTHNTRELAYIKFGD